MQQLGTGDGIVIRPRIHDGGTRAMLVIMTKDDKIRHLETQLKKALTRIAEQNNEIAELKKLG